MKKPGAQCGCGGKEDTKLGHLRHNSENARAHHIGHSETDHPVIRPLRGSHPLHSVGVG